MEWCVYIVRCADYSLYTGIAKDLAGRIDRHNRGRGGRYTRSRLPVQLVYQEGAADRGAALRRELQIKDLTRPEKEALIRQNLQPAPKRRNPRWT
jgi:predicted GIY-YIG superfamily endonuclease